MFDKVSNFNQIWTNRELRWSTYNVWSQIAQKIIIASIFLNISASFAFHKCTNWQQFNVSKLLCCRTVCNVQTVALLCQYKDIWSMIFRIIYHARKLYIVSFSICCFVALSKQKLTFQPLRHQLYADREESKVQPIKMFLCLATRSFVVVKGHIDTMPSNCPTVLGSAESVSYN